MTALTPGLAFLLRISPYILLPPAIAHGVLLALARFTAILVPDWLHPLGYVLAYPIFLSFSSFFDRLHEEYEIRSLGATRVPEVKGKLPGNLDLLVARYRQSGSDSYAMAGIEDLTKQYGNIFSITLLGEQRIITVEPNHIKAILATDFPKWEKGPKFRGRVASVLGSGVFASDGDMWKFHRSMSRPFFNRDRISDFETFGRHTDEVISIIRAQRGAAIDFQDLIGRFTLDSATEFLLGTCVHALRKLIDGGATYQGSDVDPDAFTRALLAVQSRMAIRGRLAPVWPLSELFEDKTSANIKILHRFINPIIQKALERQRNLKAAEEGKGSEASERASLLDELVHLTDDPKMIADETVNILIAGRDTTAATLSFLVYLLSQHPDVLQRLRAEILQYVGPTRTPEFSDFREMKFLRACINETLRLFPPVPGNVRAPNQATTLPPIEPGGKPFYIPAGATVPYSDMVMHRRKDLWGPDADQFDPDRFLDERLQKYLTPNPFIFVPFNAGPRICLGQQFAYNEMSFFMVKLLQAFDHVELAVDTQPPEARPPASWAATSSSRVAIEKIRPKSEFTMYIQGGLHMRFHEVQAEA
ncbi:cytochrome P450 monooxygenase pc-3 [Obba rivulosa]|uniref:Cytochrome P450 monooxygenase pc-3 n=1 Tax=Obba rivulosa TaxID=1052685 RepID=A0A8E2APF9_9APHY|nr:cytochrome P450 monooxygenase pc-3 [Obba rivulosa]